MGQLLFSNRLKSKSWSLIGPRNTQCAREVRDHAVSFFSSLCDIILAGATAASPLCDPGPRSTPSSRDLDSRSGSLKRKYVGSTPSLSEAEPTATLTETANGSEPTAPGDDSSSSSLSACSSDVVLCDEEDFRETGVAAEQSLWRQDNFPATTAESPTTTDYRAVCESERNRNVVLPGPGGWTVCPSAALAEEELVRSLQRSSDVVSRWRADSVEDVDDPMTARLCANVLMVSHGGFISQLLGHFADDFDCQLPGGGGDGAAASKILATVTPNAGLSRFLVTVSPSDGGDNQNDPDEGSTNLVRIRCVTLHDKDHLANDVDVEPLPTSEPL